MNIYYCIVALLQALFYLAAAQPSGFLVIAPSRFGVEETVCISLKNNLEGVNVTAVLLEHHTDEQIASNSTLFFGNSGCLTLKVRPRSPQDAESARLVVSIQDGYDGSASVISAKTVSIIPDPWVTFIATERPAFGPNQVVRFRIFSTGHNLRPLLQDNIVVWIENPHGIRVTQWLDVKPVGGIVELSMPLVSDPVLGTWTIKVNRNGHIHKRSFEVVTHEGPSFLVSLSLPQTLESNNSVPVTVCASYVFGKPVQGYAVIEMAVECVFKYYCTNSSDSYSLNLTLAADGCASTDIIAELTASPVVQIIVVNATVVESGTQATRREVRKAKLLPAGMNQNIRAVFQLHSTKIKPALPFYGKLKLFAKNKTVDDNITVEMCYRQDDEKWCTNIETNNSQVLFVIPPSNSNSNPQRIDVEAAWSGDSIKGGRKQIYLRPWFSPSSSYLQIITDKIQPSIECGSIISLRVHHNMPSDERFFVLIKSASSAMRLTEVTQLPTFKTLDNFPEDAINVLSLGPAKQLNGVKAFEFSVNFTSDLVPAASVLVYSVRHDGEVVADSLTFSIAKCFKNKVEATWSSPEVLPGSDVKLQIKSNGPAICAVSAGNPKYPISSVAENIYQQLVDRIKTISADHQKIDKENCIKGASFENELPTTSDNNSLTVAQSQSSVFVDSLEAFQSSGLLVMSDLKIVSRPCRAPVNVEPRQSSSPDLGFVEGGTDWEDEASNMIPSEDPIVSVRSNFNDDWLWNIIKLSGDGRASVSAVLPNSITEWTSQVTCLSESEGLSEAESSILRSFQPFFVDFSAPPVVIRHEVLHLPISIFNYMKQPIPVMLAIAPSEYFYVSSDLTKNLCVPPGGKVVEVFRLIAVKLGAANISVRAQIDPHAAAGCGPALHHFKVDHVMKPVTIKAGGQVIEETRSSMICGRDEQKKEASQPDQVDWSMKLSSSDFVDQTVISEARVSGDVFGPALLNADSFITEPMGFGDQNMVSFIANFLAIKYLLALYPVNAVGGHVTKALSNLELGYQQQLSFRHSDGSYSIFGPDSDSFGSLRLTATVVRYFSEAKHLLHIDEVAQNQSVEWILAQQMENGCFATDGGSTKIKKNQKKMISSKGLTAEIMISMLKAGLSASHESIKNGLYCVQAEHEEDLYGEMLTTYALALAGEHREASWRMRLLLKVATRSYYSLWWKQESESGGSDLALTSYGVLTLLKLGGSHFYASAADAVRTMLLSYNSNGAFQTTQDSIIGLEAIVEYSDSLPRGGVHLRVSLNYISGNTSFYINDDNRYVQQISNLPPFLTTLQFVAQGNGCVLVQTVVKYNIRRGSSSKSIKLQLRADPVGIYLDDPSDDMDKSVVRVEACMRALSSASPIGGVVVEVNLPTGYATDRQSLQNLLASQKGIKKFEDFDNHVNFYINKLTNHKTCVHFSIRREFCVENSTAAMVKVYDTGNSLHQTSMRYKIDQNCNITEIVDNYLRTSVHKWRRRRNVDSFDKFSTFTDSSLDLDVPNQISGTFKIYALPPPASKDQHKCPLCMKEATNEFPRLFCSSQLSAQVKLRGRDLLEVMQDLSPNKNATNLRRLVSYTMKRRCVCDFVDYGDVLLFMLVTPPRTFNLEAIQVIHLDESISLFPWNSTLQYLSTIKSPDTCTEILIQE